MEQINTIDQVISTLDDIISETTVKNSPLGYFAALYRKVTQKVKEGIESHYFDDDQRMEKLDVVFAKRYTDAYFAWNDGKPVTQSWKKAFELSTHYWPVVLQHLLIGMNAHISLDLGIAAAGVCGGKNIGSLENDFVKINSILSSLVNEVQTDLSKMWPTLEKILKKTGKVDNFLVDFSMELARDGAWKFARALAELTEENKKNAIISRDIKVAKKADIVENPGISASYLFKIIRLGEKGSVSDKIRLLM